jgi:hypothetical protein
LRARREEGVSVCARVSTGMLEVTSGRSRLLGGKVWS